MDIKFVEEVCNLKSDQRERLHGFYRALPELQKVEVENKLPDMVRAKNHLRNKEKMSEFFYACRLLSIKYIFDVTAGFGQKRNMSDQELVKVTRIRLNKIISKKKSKMKITKEAAIEARFDEIKYLRDNGISWRDIAESMEEYPPHLKVTFSYLRDTYKTIAESRGDITCLDIAAKYPPQLKIAFSYILDTYKTIAENRGHKDIAWRDIAESMEEYPPHLKIAFSFLLDTYKTIAESRGDINKEGTDNG